MGERGGKSPRYGVKEEVCPTSGERIDREGREGRGGERRGGERRGGEEGEGRRVLCM